MKSRVLFVDDDELVLRALRRSLTDTPFEPQFLSSPQEALVWLEGAEYAAVVADLRMPGMNGIELLSRVHQISPDTSRLMLSAHSDANEVLAAVNQGAVQRYLLKPWEDLELRRAVSEAVERFELKQEIQRLRKLAFDQNEQLRRTNQSLEEQVLERSAALMVQHSQLERMSAGFASANDGVVRALHGVSALHDPASARRAAAVSRTASALARTLELDEEAQKRVEHAALLSRLGPVMEFAAETTRRDADLVAGVESLRFVALLVRSLAERWDGSGSPSGASGDDIPLGARILAVATEWVDAGGVEGTGENDTGVGPREKLERLSGTKLDPVLVTAFLSGVVNTSDEADETSGPASIRVTSSD